MLFTFCVANGLSKLNVARNANLMNISIISDPMAMAGRVLWILCLSVHLSVCLKVFFESAFFSIFGLRLGVPARFCVAADVLRKTSCSAKMTNKVWKRPKNGLKTFLNKNWYRCLFSCTNPISRQFFWSDISLDVIQWSHWLFVCKLLTRKERQLIQYFW